MMKTVQAQMNQMMRLMVSFSLQACRMSCRFILPTFERTNPGIQKVKRVHSQTQRRRLIDSLYSSVVSPSCGSASRGPFSRLLSKS